MFNSFKKLIFCEKDVETDKHRINIHCLYPILNYELLKYHTLLLTLKHPYPNSDFPLQNPSLSPGLTLSSLSLISLISGEICKEFSLN